MANIKVNELNPAGTQLFSDAENFLNELSHDELDAISGGRIRRFSDKWEMDDDGFYWCV